MTEPASTGPAARGVRVAWDSLPASVKDGIERICGAAVLGVKSQPGGFSPGVAARLTCADGSRWFVKGVSADANPVSPGMHRREADVLRALDPLIAAGRLAAPRLRGTLDQPPWMALVLADVEGQHPALNAGCDALRATVCALAGFFTERSLQPPPPGIPTVREFQAAQAIIALRWLATLL